ncbi:MAG TPA: chemotaxis protein CheA [Gemmatimonadales bacterium]|nr:chemotaxis protein CheA [Gemmatimonadales bacterium]
MDVSKYAALFLTESREHLGSCNACLLELERGPEATGPVDGLFRAIHTVKGMAATMGYANVAELAHRLENLLDGLRTRRVAATPAVVDLLFRAVDAIGAGVEEAAAGRDQGLDVGVLVAALDAAAAPAADGAPPAAEPAAAARPSGPVAVPAAAAPGRELVVRVTLRRDAAMRGVRALLVLRRAEALGVVSAPQPAPAQLEREEFDGRLAFHLRTEAAPAAIEAAVRGAGDVEAVAVEQPEAAPATTPAAGAAAGGDPGRTRHLRVDLRRLDALMKQVGELVVAKNRLVDIAGKSGDEELDALSARMARLVEGMQSEILQARMTPVGEVFDRFPRLVRDLGRELGKQIAFESEGGEIELDRSVLDEIGEPLMHLVRNAADHGLEPAAARLAAGKPGEGRIRLAAVRERNSVAIRVSDDGRGVDRAAVLAKAKRQELVDAGVETLADDALLRILAKPGFSTAGQVSGVSGRGVGIDVVATRVRAIGGTLEIQTTPGAGTTWTLRVPLTLAIVRALLTRVGDERYAVPLAYVAETVEFDPRAVTGMQEREALVLRDRVVPTVHLRELVAARGAAPERRRPSLILEVGERRTALVVDALLGQQDIVVEPFEAPRGMPPFFGGATILADGVPALILDAAALV